MILYGHPDGIQETNGLRAIGYWKNEHHPDLPDPRDYINWNWNAVERKAVVMYLKAGCPIVQWRGWVNCYICGKPNGSSCLGDDKYAWPDGFSHYIEKHGVKPPD